MKSQVFKLFVLLSLTILGTTMAAKQCSLEDKVEYGVVTVNEACTEDCAQLEKNCPQYSCLCYSEEERVCIYSIQTLKQTNTAKCSLYINTSVKGASIQEVVKLMSADSTEKDSSEDFEHYLDANVDKDNADAPAADFENDIANSPVESKQGSGEFEFEDFAVLNAIEADVWDGDIKKYDSTHF